MFRTHPRIERMALPDGASCYIVDDALDEPQRWVRLAVREQARFERAAHNAYPGLELRMPAAVTVHLEDFFNQHLRATLGARRTLRSHSRMALVTLAEHELQPRQWICHRDRWVSEPEQCIAASVLYLFEDPALGGTNFFRARRSATETAQLVHDSGTEDGPAFAARYGIRPGYLTESNDWFEKIASVPARYNRLIVYDGDLYHCADIRAPERMVADPAQGRLTLNGFFTCRRAAG